MELIESSYDPIDKRLRVRIKSEYLSKYKNIMEEAVKKSSLPKGSAVDFPDPGLAVIVIPTEIDFSESFMGGVAQLSGPLAESLNYILMYYKTECYNQEVKTTEIIPLTGYPFSKVQSDVKGAVEAKRDICLIDTYENGKKFDKKIIQALNQIKFTYSSDEYCDLVIKIMGASNMTSIRKEYKPLLKETVWIK